MSGTVSAARFAEVVAERDALEARVQELEALVCPEFEFPPAWRLGKLRSRLLSHLLVGHIVSTNDIMGLLYADRLDPPVEHMAAMQIFKLRRKLEPFGIQITNVHGHGWFLSPDDKQAIRAAIHSPDKTNPEAL